MRKREAAPFRILVIANESVDGRELRKTIQAHITEARAAEVLIVAPALGSRVRFWVSDVDPARRAAARKILQSLRGLAGEGIAVKSSIGDPEPLQAIADWLRVFPANEIVLVTHPEHEEHWTEHDLLKRAKEAFPDLPIVHLVAAPRRQQSVVAT